MGSIVDEPFAQVVPGSIFTTEMVKLNGVRRFWYIDGKAYDLDEFAKKHPGGALWFDFNVHRDISILVHTYHSNPAKLLPILARLKIKDDDKTCTKNMLNPKLGIPSFLLSETFDARKDIPTYDFFNESHLLPVVRKELLEPHHRAAVKMWNQLFDQLCYVACLLYLAHFVAFLRGSLPIWQSTLLFVIFRTSFGAWGHYYVHGKKPNWGGALFDCNYVGTSMTACDGHVMLHHAYTRSEADIKKSLFSGMWKLPFFFRMPAFTAHKFGHMISGTFLRGIEFVLVEFRPFDLYSSELLVRLWLSAEFWTSAYYGKTIPFALQFGATLWFNTFLVLSSHDFENDTKPNLTEGGDWGLFQVKNSYDLTLVHNQYLDLFLSAGLSPHRAHHLLPYQGSGFANIYSEQIIKKHLSTYGVEWVEPKNFWIDRVPAVYRFCFLTPITGMEKIGFLEQHLSPESVDRCVRFVISGFLGIGSI